MKHLLISVIIVLSIFMLFSCQVANNEDKNNSEPAVQRPIEEIHLDVDFKTIEIDDSYTIKTNITPTNTDDYIIWSSTDENVLTVNNGIVKAVGIGTAKVEIKAKNSNVTNYISFKVMPKSNGINDINRCKSIVDSATLIITNKCYNVSSRGTITKSITKTFTATIFKQTSTTYYFITGYENFKKIDGYDYQEWTATDYNGKKYTINSIQHDEKIPSPYEDYNMAIGSINSYNLGVLTISSRGYYYEEERLFIKDNTTFIQTCMDETVATSSPITARVAYKDDLYGAPVLDSDFNFVGFVVREDKITGYTDFVSTWKIKEFIKSCNID